MTHHNPQGFSKELDADQGNPLGRQTDYPDTYSPHLLFPVPRALNRGQLGIGEDALPFFGFDLWHAYELSWLDAGGKPVVAIAEIRVPCTSPQLIESKSLKLYLNSLNQMRVNGTEELLHLIRKDLTSVLGESPCLSLYDVDGQRSLTEEGSDSGRVGTLVTPHGSSLDDLQINAGVYEPDSSLLRLSEDSSGVVEETLHSHLFKSNCPVTGQPDWGTVVISYRGNPVDHRALLQYIISYRNHQGFHEHCAERMFRDIMQRCEPESLTVAIHFLRRGGLDINPVRSSEPLTGKQSFPRFLRQ